MNEFTQKMSDMDAVIETFRVEKERLQNIMKENLSVVFDSFFSAHPQVNTIHWTQYTPYFNDGDECVFSVYDIYFDRYVYGQEIQNGDDETTEYEMDRYGDDNDGNIETRRWNEKTRKYEELVHDGDVTLSSDITSLRELLGSDEMEEILRQTFGGHSWVRVMKRGYDVSELEHE